MLRDKKAIVVRHPGNPILTGANFPNDIVTVFNSSVVKQASDRYVMVCRVEDSALGRYLWVADSKDGVRFEPRPRPLAMPRGNPVFDEYCGDTKSYWDPRITEIDGQYYITHAAHTHHECQLGLFKIDRDFERLEWLDLILPPDNRNGVLFPERIRDRYWLLHRPNVPGHFDMWIASSPDLLHWGGHRRLIGKQEVRWADAKIGGGAVPIKTSEGWLCIIHGVRIQCTDFVYSLGVALLDLEDPTRVIGLSKRAILDPKETYELLGQALSVVFTTGAVAEPDGSVKIYYGAADTVQCLATARLSDLVDSCRRENTF
jgi:predicted GH43/DUF377 family glycosyl hydrolase